MPRNSRPGGIFGNLEYDMKGTTLAERRQMQNTWDLLNEQERANDLKERELNLLEGQNNLKQEHTPTVDDNLLPLREKACEKIGVKSGPMIAYLRKLGSQASTVIQECSDSIKQLNHSQEKIQYGNYKVGVVMYPILILSYFFLIPLLAYFTGSVEGVIKYLVIITIGWVILTNIINILKLQHIKHIEGITSVQDVEDKKQQLRENRDQKIKDIYKDFTEFRQHHYNEDIEEILLLYWTIETKPIKYKDIKHKGTIEDYNQYFIGELQ